MDGRVAAHSGVLSRASHRGYHAQFAPFPSARAPCLFMLPPRGRSVDDSPSIAPLEFRAEAPHRSTVDIEVARNEPPDPWRSGGSNPRFRWGGRDQAVYVKAPVIVVEPMALVTTTSTAPAAWAGTAKSMRTTLPPAVT